MHPYPHRYRVTASAESAGRVTVGSPGLSSLETAPPPEFGGPDGLWSPETLLCAAVADCFILTFRAVARAARFEWQELRLAASSRSGSPAQPVAEGGALLPDLRRAEPRVARSSCNA
jgi:organic hydroperoxide reductase OsmC/OhrA